MRGAEQLPQKTGSIRVRVWTIGDDYPIAYHIKLSAGSLRFSNQYSGEYLGYDSKENLPSVIRNAISGMIENMAVAFFTARNELQKLI